LQKSLVSRWGFAWNGEGDDLANDASGGIGLDIGFVPTSEYQFS
jgi:hypothetical protein